MRKHRILFAFLLAIITISCNEAQSDNAANEKNDSNVPKSNKPQTDNGRRKTADEIVKLDTVKVNRDGKIFFAICSNEEFGWCSGSFPTFDQALTDLEKHRKATNHGNNMISNTCPY